MGYARIFGRLQTLQKRELRMKTRAIIRDTIGPDIWYWKSPVYGVEF